VPSTILCTPARALRAPVLLGVAFAVLAPLLSPAPADAVARTAAALEPGVRQVVAWGGGSSGAANVPAGLRGVTAIAAGDRHSLAVRADGTITQWGEGASPPEGLRGVTSVAAGLDHDLALQADGTVIAWGSNDKGQTDVPDGLTGVTAVAAGWWYSVALRSDGTIRTWGRGVAEGSYTAPAGLDGVTAIASGVAHTLALRADGTVVAWNIEDFDDFGQSEVPAGLTDVTAIAAGPYHSLAVRADGTVVAWGRNNNGQTDIPPGLRGVVAVSAGEDKSAALGADGSLVAWGRGDFFRRPPAGLPPATAISLGTAFSLALVTQPWRTCGTPALTAADVIRVAGTLDDSTYGGDGESATRATLTYPKGLARDARDALHIADTYGSMVRRIDPVTGVLTTVAGQRYYQARIGDGTPAVSVYLDKPSAVAFTAAGDLLIADTVHNRIRRVDRRNGIITTFAGTGRAAFGGDGRPATSADLNGPQGVVVSADGAVYVADSGNHRVRRIAPNGLIATIAGTGWAGRGAEGVAATASALNFPRGLVLAADGSVYVSDTYNHRVRRVSAAGTITTVAGSGVRGCYGDGGAATSAGLAMPNGLALGPEGSLYVADTANDRIRRVRPDGVISTFAGTGSPGDWLRQPHALLAGPGATMLISNAGRNQVSRVPIPAS